jgi:hypothetical protein
LKMHLRNRPVSGFNAIKWLIYKEVSGMVTGIVLSGELRRLAGCHRAQGNVALH